MVHVSFPSTLCISNFAGKNPMKTQLAYAIDNVRDEWSIAERDKRRQMADVLQFSLCQLIILSELATPKRTTNRRKLAMSSNGSELDR